MNTCISRETLQLVGPSCAELGAGWSLLALDQLNSNVKKEVKSLAGFLDPSCPYIRPIDDDVGKLQMQPVEAYERPMAKVDVKDRVNVIYA